MDRMRPARLFDAKVSPKSLGASADSEGEIMNRFLLLPVAVVSMAIAPSPWIDRAAGQEVALTPFEVTEVAKGYRAEMLKLKPVVNDKNETIGKINDFIFGKDGNIYAVLAVGDFSGVSGHLVAVPFRNLKLDDPSGYIVLPGASRTALEKLPVFVR
jgi:hypothetical protein